VQIASDNDFADVFEVRGNHRARRGAVRSVVEGNAADFVYLGLEMGGARNWILSGLWGKAELPSTDVSE
jgi:hypothetical protein